MRIPMNFTLEFLEEEILKIVSTKSENNLRVRLCITRKDGGFYTPTTNEIDYLIDSSEIKFITKDKYTLDLFKDFYVYSGYLSTIKTNNKLINTLASIFAKENELDNCILLNERKGIVEATNASLFLIKGTLIKTPLLSCSCQAIWMHLGQFSVSDSGAFHRFGSPVVSVSNIKNIKK